MPNPPPGYGVGQKTLHGGHWLVLHSGRRTRTCHAYADDNCSPFHILPIAPVIGLMAIIFGSELLLLLLLTLGTADCAVRLAWLKLKQITGSKRACCKDICVQKHVERGLDQRRAGQLEQLLSQPSIPGIAGRVSVPLKRRVCLWYALTIVDYPE